MQLTELYEQWQTILAEFSALLERKVKETGQTKVLAQIQVGDTQVLARSTFNARLEQAQYWSLAVVEQFATLLDCAELLTLFHRQMTLIEQLPVLIVHYIKLGGVSQAFIIRRLGINQTTFYAKQKNPKTWRKHELERIEEIIETVKRI